MKIVTCYKLVPDEQDVVVNADRSLDVSRAEPKISQFDLNAIEASVEIAAQLENSTIMALSVGGNILENSKARKEILSRGPDTLTLVIDEKLQNSLPYTTASVLAATATKIGFDLIVCGDGSGDLYAQQVGILLGEMLQISTISGVSKIVTVENTKLVVERTLEDNVEVLEITLPAVISVTADINSPKVPAMKAILAASKKPVAVLGLQDIGLTDVPSLVEMESILGAEQADRKKEIIAGDSDEQLATFIGHIRKILK